MILGSLPENLVMVGDSTLNAAGGVKGTWIDGVTSSISTGVIGSLSAWLVASSYCPIVSGSEGGATSFLMNTVSVMFEESRFGPISPSTLLADC
jgi:hypothetical protein